MGSLDISGGAGGGGGGGGTENCIPATAPLTLVFHHPYSF